MKKKLILSSILSIVMCLSLICGATFALFTSEDKVNIAVTSGNVQVSAVVEDLEYKTYTKDWTAANVTDTITFDNLGGTATVVDGVVTLDKIVAGDGIKFNISVDNESNVTVKYRAVIKNVGSDAALFNALDISVNDADFKGVTATTWTELAANTDVADLVKVAIVLPDGADDTDDVKIMGKTCKIEVLIQAIQGNAETSDTIEVANESDLQNAFVSGGKITLTDNVTINGTLSIPSGVETNMDLNGKTITIGSSAGGVSGFAATVFEEKVGPVLKNEGKLIISGNGTIINDKAEAIINYGDLTINGGTIIGGNSAISGTRCIVNEVGATMVVNDGIINGTTSNSVWNKGELTVNGGTMISVSYGLNNAGGNLVVNGGIVNAGAGIYISGGALEVNAGEIYSTVSGRHVIYAFAADVELNGGTFYSKHGDNQAIFAAGAANVEINGGEYKTDKGVNGQWTSTMVSTTESSIVTINGGTFESGLLVNGGSLIVNGGTFDDSLYSSNSMFYSGSAVINGGTFVDNNSKTFAKKYISAYSRIVENEDGSITIVASDVWDGTLDTAWYDGTKASYELTTAEQLAGFASLVNAGNDFANVTVNLMTDIDLNNLAWTPIATGARSSGTIASGSNVFAGTFNGNDWSIKHLSLAAASEDDAVGLFGIVTGTVANVNVVSSMVETASENAGLIAGLVVGGKIENCTTAADCSITAVDGAGGIVGRMLAEGDIIDCVNNAAVTGTKGTASASGIVSKAYYTKTGKVMNIVGCKNNGEIKGYYAGGIVALSAYNITNCVNNGKVVGTEAGGIVAEQNYNGTVSGCENNGEVYSTSNVAGGIVGWARLQGANGNYQVADGIKVLNNTNNGKVTTANLNAGGGLAGIVGKVNDTVIEISNNHNANANISYEQLASDVNLSAIPMGDVLGVQSSATVTLNGNTSVELA